MPRHLQAVPDQHPVQGWAELSGELRRLKSLVSEALGQVSLGDKDMVDSLAKLVGALTRLAEFTLKAEQTVSAGELRNLVGSMAESVSAHVRDAATCERIRRDWQRLVSEAVG